MSIPLVVESGLFILGAAAITAISTFRSARVSRAANAVVEQSKAIVEQSRAIAEQSRVEVDGLRVTKESYETANRITGGLLTGLTKEVERLNVEVADLRASKVRSDAAVRKLEQTARDLIDVLHEHNIPIPQIRHYQ